VAIVVGTAMSNRRTVVVKLGGDTLEGAPLTQVARSLCAIGQRKLAQDRLVIVHGGGAQVTALATSLGIRTQMAGGRRITDAPMLEVLEMVVAGRLNVALCAALRREKVPAVGLHAGSGVIRAQRRPPRIVSGGGSVPIDFGLVGDVVGFDHTLLEALWKGGYLPTLSCLGLSEAGEVLNLNADLAASQLAAALTAQALLAVTAVGGVRRDADDPTTRIARLTVAEAHAAIAAGTVRGGMIPKLEEACAAIAAGVERVQIVGPGELAAALDAPDSVGTLLVA
jgi:acetylglutamate kinase